MALTINTTYAGEVMNDFLLRATVGNETVQGGHIALHSGIVKEKTLPRLRMQDIIHDHAVAPVFPIGTAGTTVDERKLSPDDFMVSDRFNPRDFEAFWEWAQPNGEIVFRTLPEPARVAFIREIMRLVDEYMGEAIWTGDKVGGVAPFQKFDGIITKAIADGTVPKVASPVALTSGNIVGAIRSTRDLIPYAVRRNPNFKIFISAPSGDLLAEAIQTQQYKGVDFTQRPALSFDGSPVVDLVGFPDNTIFCAVSSASETASNIHLGIDWQYGTTDPVIQIERYRPEDERFFFKMLLKADTQIGWGEETSLYTV